LKNKTRRFRQDVALPWAALWSCQGCGQASKASQDSRKWLAMPFEKMLWYVAIRGTSERTMRRIIAVPLMLLLLTLAARAQQAAIGFCALDKTLDFKMARAGDKVALRLTRDLVVIGIIAAVATPPDDLSGDPFYAMNHSAEPTQRTGNAAATSLASSGAAVQTAILKGKSDPKSNLQEDSSGAIGIDGLKLNWVLDKPPATTMMTAKKKNFKLLSRTELLLRMAPPQM
jgi:hypothetical protein